ncbi:putative ribosome quality control (RQC) complex YloA/Tae2 family protein [Tumebacillus sp. BK434]|uniref:Rqc2 family fibronectin-binding protein n=1 Tax=Tumebacillus sp. BK434 TaxID=2512169 RepID=UPI001050D51E|nr:NFACT RNA binding domain-containing protein [Tumebacillus sp. BK434]TCP52442.1 putative ribosome quality control (RQC) complex YloA/Tae2 family protein [Tumebacillus sp. BK434]
MAFDGIVLHAVAHELSELLLTGRVDKIYQPLDRDLLLHIRRGGQNYKLLLTANASFPRAHLVQEYKGHNPAEPPMFCMLLRKHCEGGRITRIEQVGNERILHIAIENRDELGDLTERILVVEIMGRHSNVILLDPAENRILDSLVHVNFGTSRHREVLPGRTYVEPPEQGKENPFGVSLGRFQALRDEQAGLAFDKFLVSSFTGISPLLAKEITHRLGSGAPTQEQEWQAFAGLLDDCRAHRYQPTIVYHEDRPKAFSCVALTHVEGEATAFGTISEAIERFYSEKAWRDALRQRSQDLERLLSNELQKNINKIAKFETMIAEASEAEQYRIYGELITANLYQIERGMESVTVQNYYDENLSDLTIPLDPALSANENAQSCFKKYNKVKKSIPILHQQIEETRAEVIYLENVLQQLSTATWSDIEEIREELQAEGYLKIKQKPLPKGKKPPKKKEAPIKPERYLSSDGIELFVGKNNRQNEYLTMKFAHNTDTWLHTKDIPGSHVVIRAKEVPETTLLEAAQLAAFFSKGRESSQVPVDYTLIKHVWKPNGAKPGFVLYDNQKTLYVTPGARLTETLRTS